jgi:hypothetical protein
LAPSGYIPSQSVDLGSRSAYLPRAFFGVKAIPRWHWETSDDEHCLYFHGRYVASIGGVEGDYRIVYPRTIPVQTATTLESARKLAVNVALWTLPLDPATEAREDRANNKHRRERTFHWKPIVSTDGLQSFEFTQTD